MRTGCKFFLCDAKSLANLTTSENLIIFGTAHSVHTIHLGAKRDYSSGFERVGFVPMGVEKGIVRDLFGRFDTL